ncbi:MAG TPA: DUF5683 domain-containing protein [Candidatus Acidoferrum sp.]|nr:DUF5683 domain-containing protein [Candidatus Acidoferrum sp.]
MAIRVLIVLMAILAISSAFAQTTPPKDTTKPAPEKVDTLLFIPKPDSSLVVPIDDSVNLERHLYQNPTVALFKSMLVPGLGQIGNHRYIKAGVIIGLESWLIGSAIHYGHKAHGFWNQYSAASGDTARNYFYSLYSSNRDDRNKYTWFAAIATFVSMFDAYVDAHLSGAPTQDRNRKFAVEIVPVGNNGAGAALSLRF